MPKYRMIPLRQMSEEELQTEIRRIRRAIDHRTSLCSKNKAYGERERTRKNRGRSIKKLLQRLELAEQYLKEK